MLEITCPSGLKGKLRGMKVKDEQILTDKKRVRKGTILSDLLSSCWVETLDPGPYDPHLAEQMNWSKAILADRMYTLLQLRIASYGGGYEFDIKCDNGLCEKPFRWGLNLEDLDVRPLSEEARCSVRDNEPMSFKLPDGRAVRWHVLRGSDEEFLASLDGDNSKRQLAHTMARHIDSIDGVEPGYSSLLSAVEDLEVADSDKIWDEFDEKEGGVDTQIEVVCAACDGEQRVMLPLGASFFSKRKRFAPTTKTPG